METRQTSNEMFERVDVSFVFVVRFLPFLFLWGVHFEIFTVWKSDVQHQKVELVKPVVNVRIPVSRWRLRQNIGGDHIQILPQKTRDLHSGSTREFVSSNLKKIWLKFPLNSEPSSLPAMLDFHLSNRFAKFLKDKTSQRNPQTTTGRDCWCERHAECKEAPGLRVCLRWIFLWVKSQATATFPDEFAMKSFTQIFGLG